MPNTMKLILLFLMALPGAAELVSFGVRGGLPLSEAFKFQRPYNARTKLYIVGPTFELHLPLRTSIAFDALYRRLDYDFTTPTAVAASTANAWEFPVLFKYRLRTGLSRPYVGAGPSYNRITGATRLLSGIARRNPPELSRRTTGGLAMAGGLEIRALFLRVSPEIRYTRRFAENFAAEQLRTNRNQLNLLLGITF